MKIQPLCTLILLAFLQTAQSQIQTTTSKKAAAHQWSLSLSAGPAFPTSDFSTKEPGTSITGHARTGAAAELSLGYAFNRYFGAAGIRL
jgi:hypothetical protein